MSNDWKLLAISDTHLGEETSLLSFPAGLHTLWTALRQVLAGLGPEDKGRVNVGEMILMGDIPDRTLSSTAQIVTHTNAFIQTLGSALNIGKGVYIPGNHDHTLWSDYIRKRHGGAPCRVTPAAGEQLLCHGFSGNPEEASWDLLNILFGYPYGSSWRTLRDNGYMDFVVANPMYATTIGDRDYVFTHGTHFRRDVTKPKWCKDLCDAAQLDRLLGGIELEPGGGLDDLDDMDALEKAVHAFVDTLWPSSKNNPTSKSDTLWYVLSMLGGKLDAKKRKVPSASRRHSWEELSGGGCEAVKPLEEAGKGMVESIGLWRDYFLTPMKNKLQAEGHDKRKLTFVYGDTHDGGWGLYPDPDYDEVRLYNTGGWVVHDRDSHPACHLFAVDGNGREYLLDVSFAGSMSGDEPLLAVAGRDVEHRKGRVGWMFRFAVDRLL